MSLLDIHKSQSRSITFGVVIENNTNQDANVEFMGANNMFSYKPKEGINIYPLYKDLYFKDMFQLMMKISQQPIAVDLIKFQSSQVFDINKRHFITFIQVDANGTSCHIPFFLESDSDISTHFRELKHLIRMDGNTSFNVNVFKQSDLVIKFYSVAKIKKESYFDDKFYNKIKEENENLNEEKNKRLIIII